MKLHGKQRKQEKQQQSIERQKKHDSLSLAQKVEKAQSRRGESKHELHKISQELNQEDQQ